MTDRLERSLRPPPLARQLVVNLRFCAPLQHAAAGVERRRDSIRFLFWGFVVVGAVNPVFHLDQSSRKPLARAAVERARGTTKGSPRRVT